MSPRTKLALLSIVFAVLWTAGDVVVVRSTRSGASRYLRFLRRDRRRPLVLAVWHVVSAAFRA